MTACLVLMVAPVKTCVLATHASACLGMKEITVTSVSYSSGLLLSITKRQAT